MIDANEIIKIACVTEIEALEDEEEFPPLSHEKTKLEHLLEPTNFVPDEVETKEAEIEIDTLEAHAELIKRREQLKVELQAMKDQVRMNQDVLQQLSNFLFIFQPNPFLPEGEIAKDAQGLVEKMKMKGNKQDNLECK